MGTGPAFLFSFTLHRQGANGGLRVSVQHSGGFFHQHSAFFFIFFFINIIYLLINFETRICCQPAQSHTLLLGRGCPGRGHPVPSSAPSRPLLSPSPSPAPSRPLLCPLLSPPVPSAPSRGQAAAAARGCLSLPAPIAGRHPGRGSCPGDSRKPVTLPINK